MNTRLASRLTFISTLLFFVGFYALLVPLPRYLAGVGLQDWQIGLVLGAFGIASLFGRPWAGLAADWLGRRSVMVAGVAAFIAGVIGVLLTTNVLLLMGARTLQALGYVALTTAATARIADLTPPAQRGAAIARFGIAANLAMVTTPAVIDLSLDWLGLWGALTVAICVALMSGVLALLVTDQARPQVDSAGQRLWTLPRPILRPWLAAVMLGVGFGVWLQYLPLLTERRQVEPTGVLYALYGIAIILTRLITGPLQDKGKDRLLLMVGFTAMLAGLCLFAFTGRMTTYAPAVILIAISGGILHPLLMTQHVTLMPDAMRGRAVSTFYLGFDLGNGLGVWLLGFALQGWGFTALFGLAALSALTGLAISQRQPKFAPQSAPGSFDG